MSLRQKCPLGFLIVYSVLFFSFSAPGIASGAEQGLTPIGSFSAVQGDGEHAYGLRIVLWRHGSRAVGEVTYWDGNIEGQAGEFTDGTYNPTTGDVRFRVRVKRHDVQPNEYSTASFSGRTAKNALRGTLAWAGEAAQWRGESGIEKFRLPRDRRARLFPFSGTEAWQAALNHRYDLTR